MIKTYKNQTGWWASTEVLGREILGQGDTEETALWAIQRKIDDLYWTVLDLRNEVASKVTEAINNAP